MLEFYKQFRDEDLELVQEYLERRYLEKRKKNTFGVVFDILHQCDLACVGCGTNAIYYGSERLDVELPSLEQINLVYDTVKEYVDSVNLPAFINIGGGEPFLRRDIIEVLSDGAKRFGATGMGVDTNGTLDESFDLIMEAMTFCKYVGISVNGLEEYHNWWAGNKKINAFRRSMETVKRICAAGEDEAAKLEVTSVSSAKNLKDLPVLIELLADIGVKNYSIHRAMPVGRMFKHPELLPTAKDYFQLLIDIIKVSKQTGMEVHLHHSIESIHETLLLGKETYIEEKAGNHDMGSSVGIEPEGRLVFDPWCTSGMWTLLSSPGCIYDGNIRFENLLTDKGSIFDLTKAYTVRHIRCNGCTQDCAGGSRIVAAACDLVGIEEIDANLSKLLTSMRAIDPACPLYEQKKAEDEDDEF